MVMQCTPSWYCSCGSGSLGGAPESNERGRIEHEREHPDHWPLTAEDFFSLECAHCACFDHGPTDVLCCDCSEPYQPMTEVGGRRVFVKRTLGAD